MCVCGRISYIYHSSYVKCELEKIIECDGLILNPEKEIQSPSDGKDIYGHACVLSKVCMPTLLQMILCIFGIMKGIRLVNTPVGYVKVSFSLEHPWKVFDLNIPVLIWCHHSNACIDIWYTVSHMYSFTLWISFHTLKSSYVYTMHTCKYLDLRYFQQYFILVILSTSKFLCQRKHIYTIWHQYRLRVVEKLSFSATRSASFAGRGS